MILFIIIAIGILIVTIFANDSLIDCIKESVSYGSLGRKIKSVCGNVALWLTLNVSLNIINLFLVYIISMMIFTFQPTATSEYQFKINALKDNLVTTGEIHSSMFSMTGYIDGEIKYFFSRTTAKGEKIGYIPANKTYIRYDDESHPYIEVHQEYKDIPEWVSKCFFVDCMNKPTTDYYVIVAPEGTITNTGQYEIDME